MLIEAGKTYLTRGGRIATVLGIIPNPRWRDHAALGYVSFGDGGPNQDDAWCIDGTYREGKESDLDLVEEINTYTCPHCGGSGKMRREAMPEYRRQKCGCLFATTVCANCGWNPRTPSDTAAAER